MAREKGTLLQCLTATEHHVLPHKVRLMFVTGEVNPEELKYRFGLVAGEIRNAMAQIKKVEKVAMEKGYADVLEILNEPIEFGHDLAGRATS